MTTTTTRADLLWFNKSLRLDLAAYALTIPPNRRKTHGDIASFGSSLFGLIPVFVAACANTSGAPNADAGGATGDPDGSGIDSGPSASGGFPDSAGPSGSGGASGSSGSSGAGGQTGPADTGSMGSSDAAETADGAEAGGGATDGRASTGPPDAAVAGEGGRGADGGVPSALMNFFVSSDTSTTGNLGGLSGADARCQRLAAAVGHGGQTWRAYLSADNPVTNARDRIGNGPYTNSLGALVAANNNALHPRNGDPALFIDEHGSRINGQWAGSPAPLQHDILTGSTTTGMLNVGLTCGSWTVTTGNSFVGHTDGLGPGMSMAAMYVPWNASHMGQCANTAPGGGAGRIYCFVGN